MSATPSAEPSGRGSLAVAVLVVACLVAVAIWWIARGVERRALEEALAPYAGTPLPTAGSSVHPALADLGARVFDARCAGCHALRGDAKLGPNLAGITLARDPAWLRAMITRPDSMTRDDAIARALLEAYDVPMQVAGGMDETAASAVIEFLRRADGG